MQANGFHNISKTLDHQSGSTLHFAAKTVNNLPILFHIVVSDSND